MAAAIFLSALTIAGAMAQNTAGEQPNVNTATSAKAVYAAQATAATYEGKSNIVSGQAFDRFVQVWLENTDYSTASGDPNLSFLASQGITLTNYYGVTHPSQPNYVASVGGDNFGMDNDNFNQVGANTPYVASVIDLLEDKNITWGSYQEDMPYTGFEGMAWVNQNTKKNDYVRKHNPPVVYNSNTTPKRLSYQKNLTTFFADVQAQTLPQWSFITPNMTSDGHDTSVTTAGTWSRNFLEPLMNNSYFMENTLILLTFDENHSYTIGNRVFSILLGGAVPTSLQGTTDSNFYTHYSDIATVEANWNLHTLGRWDVGANVFQLVAQQTGDVYRPWTAVTGSSPTVFLNSSFAGPFNVDVGKAAYPVPNCSAISPTTGRTVLPAIVQTWGSAGNQSSAQCYYTDSQQIPDGQHPPKGYAVNTVDN